MSKLSELLKSQPISAQQAADRAAELGLHLKYGTVAAYWAGSRHSRPPLERLKVIAEVTGIPLKKLQEAAWDTSTPLGEYSPPEESHLMTERQRRLVDELIRVIVASNGAVNESEQSDSDSDTPPESGASGEAREDQEAGLLDNAEAANAALAHLAGTAERTKRTNARRKLGNR